MRLTTLMPSIPRPLLAAMAVAAVNTAHAPERLPELVDAPKDEPTQLALSIEEFVQFARVAGAL